MENGATARGKTPASRSLLHHSPRRSNDRISHSRICHSSIRKGPTAVQCFVIGAMALIHREHSSPTINYMPMLNTHNMLDFSSVRVGCYGVKNTTTTSYFCSLPSPPNLSPPPIRPHSSGGFLFLILLHARVMHFFRFIFSFNFSHSSFS